MRTNTIEGAIAALHAQRELCGDPPKLAASIGGLISSLERYRREPTQILRAAIRTAVADVENAHRIALITSTILRPS